MKNFLMSLPMLFVLNLGSSQEATAPSLSGGLKNQMEKLTFALEQKQKAVASFKGVIENAIDNFFDSPKQEQQERKSYILKMIDFFFQFNDAPLGVLPSLKEIGFAFTPSILQEYYGMPEQKFEVPVKSSKNSTSKVRVLEDWEVDARIVKIPELKPIFPTMYAKMEKTSGYSFNRMHPLLKKRRKHGGTDYRDTTQIKKKIKITGVFVPCSGFIKKGPSTSDDGNNALFVDSTKTIALKFCHLQKKGMWALKDGPVEARSLVGFIGKTGLATGYHLHLEVAVAGVQINPELLCDWITGERHFAFWYVNKSKKEALPVRVVYPQLKLRGVDSP